MQHSSIYTLLLLATICMLPEPSVPQDIVPPQLWRKLLQNPNSPAAAEGVTTPAPGGGSLFLNLCETNLCESQRVDGQCDRWARNEGCVRRDVFYVRGDPLDNDKAEMFLNLRSPWGVSCSLGRCTPAQGALYDVFVAEGCIPEQDFVSEMQDVSVRTSKQVKIYLRRPAEYYISVVRKDDFIGATDNCTYGITAGSIESERASRCFDFRRLSETDLAASNVPNCRDVMPRFDSVVSQDNSTQATLVVALIGVGLLSIALIVLVFILLRRCRHAKKKDHPVELNSIRFEGLQPTAGSDFAGSQAELEEGLVAGLGGQKQNQLSKIGTQSKKQREKLAKRLAHSDGGEAGHGGPGGIAEGREPGSGAGIIEEDLQERIQKGVGGGRLIFGGGQSSSSRASGSSLSHSSGSDRGSGGHRTPSPADELHRSYATSKQIGSSPSKKNQQQHRKSKHPASGSERGSSAGSHRSAQDVDLELVGGGKGRALEPARPGTGSSVGSATGASWGDDAGIRIDDILEEAKRANPSTRKELRVHASSRNPSVSGSHTGSDSTQRSGGSLPHDKPSEAPLTAGAVKPAHGRGTGRSVAPMMAARLGLPSPAPTPGPESVGSTMRVPPSLRENGLGRIPQPISLTQSPPRADPGWGGGVERDTLVPTRPGGGRAMALSGVLPKRDLPRSTQPGVPPPPPRPAQGDSKPTAARGGPGLSLHNTDDNGNGVQSAAAYNGAGVVSSSRNGAGVVLGNNGQQVNGRGQPFVLGARLAGVTASPRAGSGPSSLDSDTNLRAGTPGSSSGSSSGADTVSRDGRGMASLSGGPLPLPPGRGLLLTGLSPLPSAAPQIPEIDRREREA